VDVVGHLDTGQAGMSVEDDAEEVVGFPLMPVGCRIHRKQRWHTRIGVRAGDFHHDAVVVGDRHQRVNGMQLAPGVIGVVHSRDAAAQFEAQRVVITQYLCGGDQVVPADLQGQLIPVYDDAFDGGGECLCPDRSFQPVDDLVEVAAIGSRRAAR
jgi:hypothetical protein